MVYHTLFTAAALDAIYCSMLNASSMWTSITAVAVDFGGVTVHWKKRAEFLALNGAGLFLKERAAA
jgi:hypothetical protein